jgi:hypothetical protein
MKTHRFIGAFSLWLSGLALLSIGLGLYADPYAMFGTGMQPKPRVYQQARIAKTYTMAQIRPKTLLLGNSRTEAGFDPESAAFPDEARPVFNAGRAGSNLSFGLSMMKKAMAAGELRTVIVGVDFQDFLHRDTRLPKASERHYLRGELSQTGMDALSSTLTLDAMLDSGITIASQGRRNVTTMTRFGFNPRREYEVFVKREGHRALFDEKAVDFAKRYAREEAPMFSDPMAFDGFRTLAKIIDLAMESGVNVIVFTHPYHKEYLDTVRELGFWQSFEDWKLALRQVAGAVPLYDFAILDSRTTEPVPDRGNTSAMRYYWESGHYKNLLGDEMIRAMQSDLVPPHVASNEN